MTGISVYRFRGQYVAQIQLLQGDAPPIAPTTSGTAQADWYSIWYSSLSLREGRKEREGRVCATVSDAVMQGAARSLAERYRVRPARESLAC